MYDNFDNFFSALGSADKAESNYSLTGNWENGPGSIVGVTMNLTQTGTNVTGNGELFNPKSPAQKTPFTTMGTNATNGGVNLSIEINASHIYNFQGHFTDPNTVTGTVTLAPGHTFPLTLVRT